MVTRFVGQTDGHTHRQTDGQTNASENNTSYHFVMEVITPGAIENILKGLNPNKAQGPDGIPPRVLKEISKEISIPLCHLFNRTLEEGKLPDDWKTAEVTAIFKKGSKNDPGNYRPVSLTCVVCKVLETIIRDSIVNHFQDNDLYSKCQHGFRKKRSCMTQLLLTMELGRLYPNPVY